MSDAARDGERFRAGEPILLIDERRGKRRLVTLRAGQAFHSDRGFVGHEALIGALDGTTVTTSLGARYLALRPTLAEYVLEMPRGAQVIYPKDLATICHFADIGPGQTVVEAGLGSGALTMTLLQAVGPTGRVVSYEDCRQSGAHAASGKRLDGAFLRGAHCGGE